MIELKSFSKRSSFISAVLLVLGLASVGCGGHPVTGNTIVGTIRVTADSATLNAGTTTQLHAMNTNSANQTTDVTSTVTWSSASPTVAVVGPTGVLTGMTAGNATITASLSGISGAYTASVGAPAVSGLTVSPKSSTVFTRGKQAFTALATYANNTSGDASGSVTWSVSPASVATISSTGVVTAVAPGSFGVTAVAGTQQAVAVGTVVDAPVSSIAVTPSNPSIAGGTTQKFTATATYADGTTADVSKSFNWASSNTALLTIDANGLATAIGTSGSVTVTGQFGAVSAKVTVGLTSAATLTGLVVTPTSSSIANGSAEPHVATATYSDGTQKDVTGSVTWTVVPGTTSSVGQAKDFRLQAKAIHAQAAVQPEAPRDDSSPVVSVDQNGVDWAKAPGITTVQASMGGLESQSVVIVTAATVQSLEITSSKTLFPAGSTQPMHLIGHFSDGTTQDLSLTGNWVSADPTVATIDGKGNVTGVKAGKTQMSASFGGLSTTSGDLTILPVDLLYVMVKAYTNAAPIGIGEQLQMIGTYSDGTIQDVTSLATWSTANPNVYTVESYGFVHPVGVGTTEVTGTVLGRTASISLGGADSKAVSTNVSAATPSFALGTTDAFTALTTFDLGFQSDVSPVTVWTSSDPTVFTINSAGRAKAGKIGTATVTASLLGVTQTSVPVQVTGAQVWKLVVSPNTAQIAAQTGQQYKAVGFFGDGTVQDITGDAIWSTDNLPVARIDTNGLLYGVKAGTAQVVCTFGNLTVHYPITVTAATLKSVAVSPANTELPVGIRRQFSLLGTFSDGTVQDLSAVALWSSNTPYTTGILGQGVVAGNFPGVGSVSAQYGFFSGSTSVNVTSATLSSLALAPPDTTVRVGASQPLTLTGTFSDGFTQVITLDDAFVSSAPGVAQVLNSDDTAYAVGVGTTQITASYQGKSVTTNSFKVLSGTVTSIAVTPANPSLTAGAGLQFVATATYADGSTAFIGRSLTWASSNPAVLDVDGNGYATAKAAGAVTVTATGSGASASFVVTVLPAGSVAATLTSVTVTPANASFGVGTSKQFSLMATYSDGSTQDVTPSVSWTSSAPSVAAISSFGRALGISPGNATFTGSFQGRSASTSSVVITQAATVTSLVVEPTSSSIATGSAEQHTATAVFSDGSQVNVTKQVTWSVVPAVASSARSGGLVAHALTALDGSASPVTTVSPSGVNTAMTPGMAMVQASMGAVSSQSTVIVTAATVTSLAIRATRDLFPAGSTQPVQLIGTFSDGSQQDLSLTANWVSSDPTVAKIDQTGLATGLAAGRVVFTGSFGGLTASTVGFQVLPSNLVGTTLDIDYPFLPLGANQQVRLIATYADGTTHDLSGLASWQSSDPSIFPIDPATGVGFGLAPGKVQVTGTVAGRSALLEVEVADFKLLRIRVFPAVQKLAQNITRNFIAVADFSIGVSVEITNVVVWRSNDPTVLTVDASGRAKTGRLGTTQMTASFLGVTGVSADVTVTTAHLSKLSIQSKTTQLAALTGQHYTATGIFDDGSFEDLTNSVLWNTSDNTTASIDTAGYGIGMKPGQVQVTATFQGLNASVPLTVTNAKMTGLVVSPGNTELPLGVARQFAATAFFSDGTQEDVTQESIWDSSAPGIVAAVLNGQAFGNGVGIGPMTALYGTFTASTPVNVTNVALTSMTIAPTAATVRKGTTQSYTATGTFSDGFTQDLYLNAGFYTVDQNVATFFNNGVTGAAGVGTTVVGAAFRDKSATTTLQVTSDVLSSLTVSPANPSLFLGGTQQLTATGTYTDGTTGDVTANTVWTSSLPLILSIDQNGLARALSLTGLGSGGLAPQAGSNQPVTIPATASSGGQTRSFQATVLPPSAATLTSVAVSPNTANFAKGTTQQFTLTGTYSDGSTQDLSSQATWTTSAASVGTISSTGLATGAGVGSVQFTGSYGGKTSTTGTVSVTPATLTSIVVTPSNPSFAKGTTQQFTVIGTYTDGTTQNLTSSSTYTSSNQGVVSVTAGGLATGAGTGSAQVTITSGGQTVTTGAVTVTAATLTSIAVTPSSPSFAKGTTQQFTVTGTYSDGTTQNLTSSSTYTSSNTGVVSVSGSGLATGAGTGSAQVTITSGGQTVTTGAVTVTAATLTSIAVTPSNPSFAKGTTQQFTVTGTYSDGTTQNLTSSSTYTSSNTGVVSVSGSGLATGAGTGSAQVTITSGGQTVTTGAVTVTPATLTSIAVTPSNPSFAKGTTTQFTVTGTYSDGTTQDLTGNSVYTSSNQGVVSVGSNGLASGVGTGSAQVTITSGGQTVTTGAVTVTPATLTSASVTPTSAHAAAGTMVQLTATGTYSDGSTADISSSATWTTSDQTLATVNSTGLVTGVSAGLATVTAQSGSSTSSATVRVSAATLTSVAISPSSASFAAGTTQKFTMTGTFSDGSTQDLSNASTWSSSATSVATVDATGLVTGVTAGSVSFTASYNGQTATTATVTVAPATLVSIAVTPSNPSFAKGTTTQFHVTGTYSDGSMRDLTGSATFTSSDPTVVSISSTGAGQGLTIGSVQLTASVGGQTASTGTVTVTPATLSTIAITPSTPSFAAGTTQQFTATGTFSDGSTQDLSGQVVWTSSNPQVMTIGSTGVASSFQVGTAQVTAALNGTTATTGTVRITPATLSSLAISPTSVQIAKGTVKQFTATGSYTDGTTQNVTTSVTWTTSDGTVVAINANGLATGTGLGTATVTASLQGQTASTTSFQVTAATLVSIAFNPTNPTVAAGTTAQVMVIGTFSDGSTQDLSSAAMFNSSNPSVATANSGVLTGVGPGTSTITVQVNGVTSSFTAAVSNATLVSIAITPTTPAAIAKGTLEQFTATGTYSDGSTQNLSSAVSWSSSNPSVFTVNSVGQATGTGVGSGQLTASYQGQTATTPSFQVTPATVSSLVVTPGNLSVTAGTAQQYTATASYSDGTTQDVSSTVTWSTNNQSVATVSSTGFVSAVAVGNVAVKAQLQSLSGTANLTVTGAAVTLQRVVVAASSGSGTGSVGATQQFTATAVYSDQTTQNVTGQATWSSTNTNVATVTSTGLATLVGGGSASIQAQFGGMTGSAAVTVTTQAATLQTISITPSPASSARGLTEQFTAKGNYSDGSTQDLTSQVSWQSSNTTLVTINSSGLANCLFSGQVMIQASYQGQTAQSTLTVSAATLQTLSVMPTSASLANGTKQQFTATGTLSDGSTVDFTTSVNWSTSNTSLGTVNATGLATGVGVGQVTITAQAGGVSSTATLTSTSATATSVQLTPASVTSPVGGVQQLQATAMFSDGTSQDVTNSVSYTTTNANVVTVDANGRLKGTSTGMASVTATLGSASATSRVDISTTALNSLAVTPANLSLAVGLNQQLTATGTFADGSTQDLTQTVIWRSSNPQVVSVSSTGVVTVNGVGMATITATTGSISATDQVTATAATVSAITVSPGSTTLAAGQTQQFAATASFTDGSQQTVTSSVNWSVSDPSKGTISNSGGTKGFFTSSAAGTLNVTATLNSRSGSAPVTVLAAALTTLRVTPNPVSVPAGTTQALTVTGTYTDGSTQNVTSSTTWMSGSASVATVNTSGVLRGITAGTTSVTATVGSTTATDNVTVTAAVLSSISVIPTAPSVALGLHQQMTATGTYTDGSTMDITSQVQWSSSSASVATISGTGLVNTLRTGTSTLTATLNSISGTAALTVTAASLQSIAVTSGSSSFALGLSLQLYATGTYSDGTTQNLTSSVTWSSSAPAVGMVNSAGLATGVTTGGFTARATMSGVTGTLPLTVTAAVLQTIVVTPANQIIVNVLGTTQFTATGHYSDGTTQNLTNSAHWTLSGPVNVGTISQTGQLSGVNVGVAGTVTATVGTISGSTGFTVVGL